MGALTKKVELIANLAIIVVAILLAVVFVRNYFASGSRTPADAEPSSIHTGTKLSIPGVDWNANSPTLVMALSTQCHFCTESASFYQRVAEQRTTPSNLRVIAVFPQPVSEAQKYLTSLGVIVDDVKQAQLDAMGVSGTPTLVLANRDGVVSDSWRGKLPSAKESEVLSRLK
ncbi:MAG: peroxiredoxin family protein [Pyrinomonadaceae bacterium]